MGDSQSNGEVENAIEQGQGQFRAMRLSMQSSSGEVTPDNHVAALWLLPHSDQTLNTYSIGQDGKTARQRLKGRIFKAPVIDWKMCLVFELKQSHFY